MEAGIWSLISARQDRLEVRVGEHDERLEEVTVLRAKVADLSKAVDRNTTALYTVGCAIVLAALGIILFGKGVVG